MSKRSIPGDINYSRFLEQEFNKSLQFKKKHEKEISTLIAYQQNMKKRKEHDEQKLQRLFQKELDIDNDKKQKDLFLRQLKLNKDQQFLNKHKENDYLDQLDASWCFYQEYSPRRDMKPIIVESERRRVLGYLEKSLSNCVDPLEKAALKQKIGKLKGSESSLKKLNVIDSKIKNAQLNRHKSLDISIDKIKQHDLHIQDVIEKNQVLNEEKDQYYKNKVHVLQEKIKLIEEQQKLNNQRKRKHEGAKEQKRTQVKTQQEQLGLKKDLLHLHHLEEKHSKINYLEDQRQLLMQERQQLIDLMAQQKQYVRTQIDNLKYPLLNSINYKALNY